MRDSDRCAFCTVDLTDDATFIAELQHSTAILHWDQTFPGRTLVILNRHAEDILDIPVEEFNILNAEMLAVASAVRRACGPSRMNYAILGNEVPHIHWHVIPRYESDPNWGRPPWPIKTRLRLADDEYVSRAETIRAELGIVDNKNP